MYSTSDKAVKIHIRRPYLAFITSCKAQWDRTLCASGRTKSLWNYSRAIADFKLAQCHLAVGQLLRHLIELLTIYPAACTVCRTNTHRAQYRCNRIGHRPQRSNAPVMNGGFIVEVRVTVRGSLNSPCYMISQVWICQRDHVGGNSDLAKLISLP